MLTKKDYIAIGNILKLEGGNEQITDSLANYFASDNPNFDKAKFMKFVGKFDTRTIPNMDESKDQTQRFLVTEQDGVIVKVEPMTEAKGEDKPTGYLVMQGTKRQSFWKKKSDAQKHVSACKKAGFNVDFEEFYGDADKYRNGEMLMCKE